MKTLIGSLIALGLFSGAASAEYCPPGYGGGYGYSSSYNSAPSYGYGHRSYSQPTYSYGHVQKVVVKPVHAPAPAAVEVAPPQGPAPAPAPEAAPAPAPEAVPQK